MFDLSGKTIQINSADVKAIGNQASLVIPVDNLPSSTYIVRIQVGKEVFAKKITIAN